MEKWMLNKSKNKSSVLRF